MALGTRRVPLETGYYEVYNQPNVELVDINETPIERITPNGIETSEREFAFDIIIYATGFDAITGAFDRIDISGVDGRRLKDPWQDGPQTYLGVLVEGFPNMLMVMGPHAGLGNFTRTAEYSVEWVTGLIRFASERGLTRIEATAAGVAKWTDHVLALGQGQLMNEIGSWMTGVNRNVEGSRNPGSCVTAAGIPPIASIAMRDGERIPRARARAPARRAGSCRGRPAPSRQHRAGVYRPAGGAQYRRDSMQDAARSRHDRAFDALRRRHRGPDLRPPNPFCRPRPCEAARRARVHPEKRPHLYSGVELQLRSAVWS
jgi:hypothetical protein